MSRISNSNNDNRRINSLQILGYKIESIKMLYTKLKDYEENDLYFLWMCVFEMFPLNVLSASFINRKQSSLSSDKTMQKDCKMNTKRNREWIKKREKRNEKSGEQNERNEQASLQLWNILIHIYLFERQTKTTHTHKIWEEEKEKERKRTIESFQCDGILFAAVKVQCNAICFTQAIPLGSTSTSFHKYSILWYW